MKYKLLDKEISFEYEGTVEVSVEDILNDMGVAERLELAKELAHYVGNEDTEEIVISNMSLEDEYKLNHFRSVMHKYSLDEVEKL
jgi:hypothetical protein